MTELLAPAGNLEKLKIAFDYGADAVYLGGTQFGLRTNAGNFSLDEISQGISYGASRKGKIYVVLNILAHHEDIDSVVPYLRALDEISPDGLIISDPGLIKLAKEHTNLELHLSTQASATNIESLRFWKEQGISRVVLAREVSAKEAKEMKEEVDIELEMFVHGSMCNSYSGKCVISNYTHDRDANRGGCVQSCRFKYHILEEKETSHKLFLLNSKDLQSLSYIPELLDANVDSLKIEGRMKSNMYLANTVATYREVIDHYKKYKTLKNFNLEKAYTQINKISNRTFFTGFLDKDFRKKEDHSEIMRFDTSNYFSSMDFIGTIKEIKEEKSFLVEVAAPFCIGDNIEFLMQDGKIIPYEIKEMKNLIGENIEKTRPNMVVVFPWIPGVQKNTVIRKEKKEVLL